MTEVSPRFLPVVRFLPLEKDKESFGDVPLGLEIARSSTVSTDGFSAGTLMRELPPSGDCDKRAAFGSDSGEAGRRARVRVVRCDSRVARR